VGWCFDLTSFIPDFRLKSSVQLKIFDHPIRPSVKEGLRTEPIWFHKLKKPVYHLSSKISHSPIEFAGLSTLLNIGKEQIRKFGAN